jgi:hypothetical protein
MASLGYGKMYGLLIGIVSVFLVGAFLVMSYSPTLQLSPTPPPEFLNAKLSWTPRERTAEEALAGAYWDCARRLSRAMYVYGDRLPYDVPDAFKVDEKLYPSAVESASAARARYWANLRKVWDNPKSWKRVYEWHTNWFFQGSNY